jgi:hypothetical protein
MTREDTKIIFSNVAELALFSDMFVERLDQALGSVLDGGIGDDHVGELFLELVRRSSPIVAFFIMANLGLCRFRPWSLHTRLTLHGIQQHYHI